MSTSEQLAGMFALVHVLTGTAMTSARMIARTSSFVATLVKQVVRSHTLYSARRLAQDDAPMATSAPRSATRLASNATNPAAGSACTMHAPSSVTRCVTARGAMNLARSCWPVGIFAVDFVVSHARRAWSVDLTETRAALCPWRSW